MAPYYCFGGVFLGLETLTDEQKDLRGNVLDGCLHRLGGGHYKSMHAKLRDVTLRDDILGCISAFEELGALCSVVVSRSDPLRSLDKTWFALVQAYKEERQRIRDAGDAEGPATAKLHRTHTDAEYRRTRITGGAGCHSRPVIDIKYPLIALPLPIREPLPEPL